VSRRKSGKKSKAKSARNSEHRSAETVDPLIGMLATVPERVLPIRERSEVVSAIASKPEKAIRLRSIESESVAEPPFAIDAVPWFPTGRFCPGTSQPGRYLQHAAGAYFVQDAGSMLALRLLDPQPHEVVADVCAAPGGKATGILEVVGPGSGFLLANEPIRGRMPALTWTLARVGYPRYATSQMDVEKLAEQVAGRFDAVLVDAPCSGQTLVARGRQSNASFNTTQVNHSAARQIRILQHAAKLVRPGGRLVYSTCTFATEENEMVAATFLAKDPRWQVLQCQSLTPWLSPVEPGGYRLWPHRDRCAGAYAIAFRCGDGDGDSGNKVIDSSGNSRQRRGEIPPELAWLSSDVGRIDSLTALQFGRQWIGWPDDIPDGILEVASGGPEIAYQPSKTWMPAHALALRRDANWQPHHAIEVSDEIAQRYLQGLTLEPHGLGWSVVRWRGQPLGWIHSNAQRANNSLPQAARLNYAPPIKTQP
jgi:16S rRNA C967 or C1407 C5-methylase (RsmB/RsmF family)/NOL1/NOP2/fmu family ribosome biogenesis protein